MEKFICLQKHTKSLQLKDSKLVPNHDLIPNMQYVQYNEKITSRQVDETKTTNYKSLKKDKLYQNSCYES